MGGWVGPGTRFGTKMSVYASFRPVGQFYTGPLDSLDAGSTTQVIALPGMPCPRLDRILTTRLGQVAAAFDDLSKQRLLLAC